LFLIQEGEGKVGKRKKIGENLNLNLNSLNEKG
jgi:hypothetical protein